MAPLQILMDNRHTSMALSGVTMKLATARPAAEARVTAAKAPARVRPGQTFVTEVTLQPRRGTARVLDYELTVPPYLRPGTYRLVVASARDLFTLENDRAAARFADRSLDALLELIRMPRSASELVVVLVAPRRGVLVDGREMAALPGSVARLLQEDVSGRVAPTLADFIVEERRECDMVLRGFVIRDIDIIVAVEPLREGNRP